MIRKIKEVDRMDDGKILIEYWSSSIDIPKRMVFITFADFINWLKEEWDKPRYNSPGDSPPVDDFL